VKEKGIAFFLESCLKSVGGQFKDDYSEMVNENVSEVAELAVKIADLVDGNAKNVSIASIGVALAMAISVMDDLKDTDAKAYISLADVQRYTSILLGTFRNAHRVRRKLDKDAEVNMNLIDDAVERLCCKLVREKMLKSIDN
jgi:hypothetical protein